MIEFLVSLGVDKATFNFLMPLGRGSDNNEDLFTTYQKISIYKKIQKIAHGNNLSIDCRRIKEAGNGFLDCPAGKTLIHIDYSGRVSPCSWVAKLWPDLTTTVSSSLLDDTLLTAFRERMLKITADACDNCLIQNDCGRGCPVIIQLLKQKYDLLCIYKKKNE
jgi:radical SAM protein with 4Fe4S-binding SPASM domain